MSSSAEPSSFSPGTLLQNRYRVVKVIGQGGFGRTYLVEDEARFQERVVLKEYIPSHRGTYAVKKSRELFQREAAVMHQIEHPQIPKFQAVFEEDKRLFLIQDYVEGKPYSELLEQRVAQKAVFSQGEVLQFLQQILPVLDHIHSKNIIHRDISPDNIILRDRDQMPVLIDFGVVKEAAEQLQGAAPTTEGTTVGKMGYAPSEQLQTGKAYPSSDLYALAVTAVVFLTGRQPQDLLDESTLVWHWQNWVPSINPWFAQVLTRMLSARPNNRYQSATEVSQALRSLKGLIPTPPPTSLSAPPPPKRVESITAVQSTAGDYEADSAGKTKYRPMTPSRSRPKKKQSVVGMVLVGGIIFLILAGVGAVVSSLLNYQQDSTASSVETEEGGGKLVRLNLQPGKTFNTTGQLENGTPMRYRFQGSAGQPFSATLSGQGVSMTVLGADQQPVDANAQGVTSWKGNLPNDGDYYLELVPAADESPLFYSLAVDLGDSGTRVAGNNRSSGSNDVEYFSQSISFSEEEETVEMEDWTAPDQVRRFLVSAEKGDLLSLKVLEGDVSFDVRYPDGKKIADAEGLKSWRTQLLRDGQYQIDMIAAREEDFVLEVGLRTLE